MPPNDELYHANHETDLRVSGAIYPDPASDISIEVSRGMVILTHEGREAGQVAAVILNRHDRQVTHILLCRLSPMPEYRLVPVSIIEQVHEEKVLLRVFSPVMQTLSVWQGS